MNAISAPSTGDTVTPAMSIYDIARITTQANQQGYQLEAATTEQQSRFSDALVDYNNASTEATKETSSTMRIMNDINIGMTIIGILTLPLAVLAPVVAPGVGVAEASAAFVETGTTAANLATGTISAGLGATQAAVQLKQGDAKQIQDISRAMQNAGGTNIKQLSAAVGQDIKVINAMDANLGDALQNYASAQTAYKA